MSTPPFDEAEKSRYYTRRMREQDALFDTSADAGMLGVPVQDVYQVPTLDEEDDGWLYFLMQVETE